MSLLSHHCCTEGDSSADLSLISMQWWKPIARSASGDCGWVAIIVLEDSEQWRHLNAGSSRKLQPWGVSECASLLRKRGLSSRKTHEVSWWNSTSSLLCGYYQHLNEKGKIVIANSPVWGRVAGCSSEQWCRNQGLFSLFNDELTVLPCARDLSWPLTCKAWVKKDFDGVHDRRWGQSLLLA